MAQIKVRLLRPLNGEEIGKIVVYAKADADRLASKGAVQILGPVKPRQQRARKQAPKPRNKMAQAPENKAQS